MHGTLRNHKVKISAVVDHRRPCPNSRESHFANISIICTKRNVYMRNTRILRNKAARLS